MQVLFEILISLFERAYLLAYEPKMSGKQLRRWCSWDDYMREWCERDDFRALLPRLLQGEDLDFAHYITQLASEPGLLQRRDQLGHGSNQVGRPAIVGRGPRPSSP